MGVPQDAGAAVAREFRRPRRGAHGGPLLLLALLLPGGAFALDPSKALTQFGLDVWQLKQGLPQSTVSAIAQTRDGYLWVGTQEGLARFDGVRFTVFDRKNTPALENHNILALLEDRRGALWIGTFGAGLKRLQGGVWKSYGPADGLSEEIISAIAEDRDGSLWIGTFSRGVNRLEKGRFTSLTTKNGLSSDEIRAIYPDRDGSLWIGTRGGGINRLKEGRVTAWTTREGLPNDQVTSVCGDGQGGVWVGTRGGLARISEGRVTVPIPTQNLGSDAVISLYSDRGGTLWIGTVGGGLARYESGRASSLTEAQGLSDDTVHAFLEDREGSLWIGTSGGLDRLRPGRFTTWSSAEGLSGDDVRPVFQDREGNVWIGALGSGLNRFAGGAFTAFTTKDGLLSDRVWAIHQDPSGDLWVGTREGLNRLARGKWTAYTTRDGLPNNLVLALASDRDGALWIGTSGGLARLRDGRFTTFGRTEGLTNERIIAIVPGPDGTLWLGTMGGGLNRVVRGRAEGMPGPITRSFVYAIHPDPDGSVWVGTGGDGLHRFRAGRWSSFTTREGLFDDVVYAILEDGRGYLWMSSNRGVWRVAKTELERLSRGEIPSVRSFAYDTADGMKESECNGGFQPSAWKTRDGRLWFPTVRGVAVVDPERVEPSEIPPPLVIEHVVADAEKIPGDRPAKIGPGKGRFEFHYTALALLAPEKTRFRYRLEGLDRDWVEAGSRRVAYYTNLPAGSYRFRVTACDGDGVCNEKGASFSFVLRPYFYRAPWFLALAGLAFLAGAVLIHRVRLRAARLQTELAAARLEALKAQLQPHFLFNTFNTILPLIYRDPDSAAHTLVQLGDLLRASLEQDATRLVPLRSELDFLNKYLGIQMVRYRSRLTTAFDVEEEALDAAIPSLILQPLVENAIKHGISKHPGPGRIEIACRREGDFLYLRVWNTAGEELRDASQRKTGGGIGLTNIRERLAVIYGDRFHFSSAREDEGFEVVIRLPLQFLPRKETPSETPAREGAEPFRRSG
jgi:ligand-binding sensor domain-containing protein